MKHLFRLLPLFDSWARRAFIQRMRRVFLNAMFCGWIKSPFGILLSCVIFVTGGEVSKAVAQDAGDSSNDSASEMAAHRYEAAGESYQGGNSAPALHNEAVDHDNEAIPRADPVPHTDPVPVGVVPQIQSFVQVPSPYQAIVDRNIFGLNPVPVANPSPHPAVVNTAEPDLVLTGVFGVGSVHCAIFELKERGKTPSNFTLQEGEQNEWLEVRSIDAGKGMVKAFLKQPVMRIQNAGNEVVFSFEIHGAHR